MMLPVLSRFAFLPFSVHKVNIDDFFDKFNRSFLLLCTESDQHQIIAKDLQQISDWFQSQSHVNTSMTEFTYGSCTGHRHYSNDHVVSLQINCENGIGSNNVAGLGGIGGLGGNFGQLVLVGFEQQPRICTVQHAGKYHLN